MKPSDTRLDRLVAETFHDDWNTGDPSRHALAAAKYARQRGTVRKLVVVVCGIVLFAATFVTLTHISPHGRRQIRNGRINYTVLSDAELLAQVHDRPLLALRNGEQITKVIVLENEASAPAAGSEP